MSSAPPTGLPSISLVVPSLDQCRFLPATLESLLGQGYPRLEVHVQDGGSTDGSLAVLETYRGRISFESAPDRGQADALNRGMTRLSGEVLGYLNSDDLLLPGALKTVGHAFAADPALAVVYGQAIFVDETGVPLGDCLTAPWSARALAERCVVAQPAAFFRREVWERTGPFDVALHHALDYDYWLRVAAWCAPERVRYLEGDPLAAARLHGRAKTVAGWDRALDEVFDVCRRRAGSVSLWWCVAKWDHRLDGRSQALAPHPVPWRAYPPALLEFLFRSRLRPSVLRSAFERVASALEKRAGRRRARA